MERRLRRLAALALLAFAPVASAWAEAGPAERLAGALRFRTLSHEDPADFDPAPFLALHAFLERSYPATHRALERERVAEWSLLYTWRGSDPDLPPILLTSHLDVVPAPEDTLASWSQPPFDGIVADGFVWGRGALDNKSGVTATLEAVEGLVSAGFRPRRTVYLAFGHDEEIGGDAGAGAITDLLAERGVRLWFSLDEGLAILAEVFPGVERPAALVGVAEKGFLTVTLTARAPGGHSSLPPPSGAIGHLARAIQRVEENPLPARVGSVAGGLLDALAPELPWLSRTAIEQRWLTGPLLERQLAADPATNAMIRTTTAVTIVRGGDKANVLPRSARASVNFRLIPGDRVEDVVAHLGRVIDDPEIEIEVVEGREASAVSSADSDAYATLVGAIEQVAPDALVAPGLVVGGTDTKHYGRIADDAYRFLPVLFLPEDRTRFHGVNERIPVAELERAIRFYTVLIERSAGG